MGVSKSEGQGGREAHINIIWDINFQISDQYNTIWDIRYQFS